MFYVLNAAPANSLSWVLSLDGYPTLDACDRAISWQIEGGFGELADWLICKFARPQNRFRVVAMPKSNGHRPDVPPQLAACTWAPDRGPYTAEAWEGFCKRLGYDPDGEAVQPLPPGAVEAMQAYAKRHGRRWKSMLREAWMGRPPHDDGGVLRELRNTHGADWLKAYRLPKAGA